jgi:hypothetical protein
MKTISLHLLMLVLSTQFISCGDDEEAAVTTTTTETVVEEVADDTEDEDAEEDEEDDGETTQTVDTSGDDGSDGESDDETDGDEDVAFGLDLDDTQVFYSSIDSASDSNVYSAGGSTAMHDCSSIYANGVIRSIHGIEKDSTTGKGKFEGLYIYCREVQSTGELGDEGTKISILEEDSGGSGSEVETTKLPVGLRLYHDGSDVTDFRLIESYSTYLYSTSLRTPVATSLFDHITDYSEDLQCDPYYVLTGVNIEYDEISGDRFEIDEVNIECTKLNI